MQNDRTRQGFYRLLNDPQELKNLMEEYQNVFGNYFGINELLKVIEIEAKVEIASSIKHIAKSLKGGCYGQ